MAAPIDAVGAKSNSTTLLIRRIICYVVLTLVAVISLIPFYILIINMTREHSHIQKGFSVLPEGKLIDNFKSVINNQDWKMLNSLKNSLIVSALSALLSTYFSALTAYAIHVYDFKLRKPVFTFILMIMMVPTQVSALGFVRLMTSWKLIDNFIPLIVPSISAPATFFFM